MIKIALLLLCFTATLLSAQQQTINLAGQWGFQLDANDFERAFENSGAHKDVLNDFVVLPGTTDSNKKGIPVTSKPINRLSRY